MVFNVNERPPLQQLILFAIQMMLSVFVATVLIGNICGVDTGAVLVGAGLATLINILVTRGGTPMFMSSSGAFVAPVLLALSVAGYTGVFVGCLTSCIVYCIFGMIFSRVDVDKIYKVFPRALIGSVTAVIGINLMPFILTYVQINNVTHMWGIVIAFITMFSIAMISWYAKGICRILPFLLGTLIGYGMAVVLTVTGIYPIVDFSIFENLTLFRMPVFAFTQFGETPIAILAPVVFTFIAYTISAMMEILSDNSALGGIIGKDLYREPGLARIFYGVGLGNFVNGMVGALGICSYGEGVACIGFSKVASVWVTGLAAIMLIMLGFIAPVQAFIASIPSCVFAGAALILYGFIATSGIKMLQSVDLNNQKNLVIVSSTLGAGISGLVVGGEVFSLTATALALVIGVILNFVLKE